MTNLDPFLPSGSRFVAPELLFCHFSWDNDLLIWSLWTEGSSTPFRGLKREAEVFSFDTHALTRLVWTEKQVSGGVFRVATTSYFVTFRALETLNQVL